MSEVIRDVTSEEYISQAIIALLNTCPFIDEDISFACLPEDGGIAIYPTGGAVIQSERRSITDDIRQQCAYSFALVKRSYGYTETRKMSDKELLDTIGKWLERQPVRVIEDIIPDGEEEAVPTPVEYILQGYPLLTGGRVIEEISRQSSAQIDSITEDQSELWAINLRLLYRNEFHLIPV